MSASLAETTTKSNQAHRDRQMLLAEAGAHRAVDVVESDLEDDKKRSEILKIAHRMAKLRDIDRLHQAEQTLRGARAQQETAARAVVTADLAHFGSWGP